MEEEELRLNFNWEQTSMSDFAATDAPDDFAYPTYVGKNNVNVNFDVLMYGIPHHQERLQPTAEITRLKVHAEGCTPTLHGMACPIVATAWSQLEHLHPVSFHAERPARKEMLPAIAEALVGDISYDIPLNYKKGAGGSKHSSIPITYPDPTLLPSLPPLFRRHLLQRQDARETGSNTDHRGREQGCGARF